MRFSVFINCIIVMLFLWGTSCTKESTMQNIPPVLSSCDSFHVSYWYTIRKIMEINCNLATCHDTGSINGDYTTYESFSILLDNKPGTFESKVFVDNSMPMPPPTSPGPLFLEDSTLKILQCWLDVGHPNN